MDGHKKFVALVLSQLWIPDSVLSFFVSAPLQLLRWQIALKSMVVVIASNARKSLVASAMAFLLKAWLLLSLLRLLRTKLYFVSLEKTFELGIVSDNADAPGTAAPRNPLSASALSKSALSDSAWRKTVAWLP